MLAVTARTIVRKLNLQSDRAVFTRFTSSVTTWTHAVKSYLHKHD